MCIFVCFSHVYFCVFFSCVFACFVESVFAEHFLEVVRVMSVRLICSGKISQLGSPLRLFTRLHELDRICILVYLDVVFFFHF